MSENLATSGPSVDTHAPDLTLSTVSGLERRISHGEPRVLAFLQHGLGHEPPRELAAIRAELRGLGAQLLVISPHGIWSVLLARAFGCSTARTLGCSGSGG